MNKACLPLCRLSIILWLSLTAAMSYSADLISLERGNKAALPAVNSQKDTLKTDGKTDSMDEFCVVERFSYFVDWVMEGIKRIDNEHPESSPEAIIEEAKIVLDLSMPEIKHEGTMELDKGQKIDFPDLFSEQAKKSYSKEAPSRSFGGRILMDDAELESMEQYRINNVREAVRGAEISLEFKTN
jgi:hypothetical protein